MEASSAPNPIDVLIHLAFAVTAQFEARAGESGLSLQQARLLGVLRDREPTINELTEMMGTDKSSMSGAVARAERHGLVSRHPDQKDGRVVRVRLEDAGRELVARANVGIERDLQHMFAALTDRQRSQWSALTVKMIAAEASQRGVNL